MKQTNCLHHLLLLSVSLSIQAATVDDNTRLLRERLLREIRTEATVQKTEPWAVPDTKIEQRVTPGSRAFNANEARESAKVKRALLEKKRADEGGLPSPTDLLGRLDWGAGLAISFDVGSSHRVKRATLDANNVIRVEADEDIRVGAILESHFRMIERPISEDLKWAGSIFVGLKPGEDFIDALSAGIMIGFQRGAEIDLSEDVPEVRQKPGALTLGVGALIDPNTQVLGDGLEPNQQIDPTTDALRLKETTQLGVLVFIGFSY